MTCTKGCGPDVTSTTDLGTKSCACNIAAGATAGTYLCGQCQYPQPLPACYAPATNAGVADPPACASGVADKVACTAACSGVCTVMSDAGKLEGCVCVQLTTLEWSCQTQWWM